jgi:integrase
MGAAVDAGLIARSPCRIKGASKEHVTKEMKFATAEDVGAIADAAPERYRALILTAAYSGLRWGELAGLRVRRVDLLHKTITVAEQLTEVRGELMIGPPKTPAALRTVSIPGFVAEALERHLSSYVTGGPDALVLTSPEGAPLRRSSFTRRVWLPATRAAGIEGLRFHDLRHTGLTLAAASGAPLKALMARAGHTTPDAALRYQHVISGQDQDIADYLENLGRRTENDRRKDGERAPGGNA